MTSLTQLPGGDLISQGLADHAAQRLSPEACLIAIARTRLGRAGLTIPPGYEIPEPEHQLYALLGAEPGDAYSRYNGLIRQLISFSQALEHQRERADSRVMAHAE
jgi:hypothetical protein